MKKFNIIKNITLLIVLVSTLLVACYPEQSLDYTPELKTFPAITFTGFSPSSGYPGTPITITGTNFGEVKQAAKISFSEADVDIDTEIVSYTDTEIVVLVPEYAGTGQIGLSVWTNETQSTSAFTYLPGVEINTLSKEASVIGDIISISGSNFGTDASAISVLFNGIEATILNISNTEIEVEVPDSTSGNVSIRYDNGNRETVGPIFVYINPSIVFDEFLEANPEFGGCFDRSGSQPSGYWPSTKPINFIGDREWEIHGNDQSGRDWGVTDGDGILQIGPARGFAYDISDHASSGYTKPTLLTLEANFNLGTFNNNTPPRLHRGFSLGFLAEPQTSTLTGNGNPATGLRGVIITPDSNEIFLWDGAKPEHFTFEGIERVPIPTPYDRNADHHIKLVVDTTTGKMVSFEFDGTLVNFSVSPNFTDLNTKYIQIGGGSNGGSSKMDLYDVSFY
ncbi:IPT/TIG domain-containing protein [Polaribacter vadi]|uniref:IPT/TIG domain-containing protein n=1 Tax=Polaribacter vadi TaxID=1774273 RepID=UPI0030EE9B1D